MLEVLCAVLAFLLILALTFTNGYWLITLDELELDHLNPADVCKRLNRLVAPEVIAHGVLILASLVGFAPGMLVLNLPLALWHGRKYLRNENHLDPTDILRFKNLKATRHEAIAKILFYGLQIIYAMFWMVSAIVTSSKRKTTG
ncbi:hypothetical protein H257_18518 [Aphanomyces astaci]|uniref:ER-derived vesicles protein ERV14 n=1 Tax=Aphanomyces astaci TaxID=112090 RepID=W4FCJ3_APHAT|nr:hypothetical protein H257_18518 [Aphanomyces astaci]ETV64609.1 hypothetical protein H257_18518 [Aphanomyces astaci]RHY14185.1 hypothetical protein DYB36_004609 [Aphanomyces astaci]RHY36513.1 hypothetical protein DYB38_002801 [Aphanomyces astaci]RHY44595.1 hypothetical protein DYB30_004787 [Aphanomyces astaci]RHY62795.1 hypothetical protein DYB34_001878 [Aphanomyces astaci]|eukprot:XP_009845901.1 hypothetical protein H257_18518 [Aphanomyces astaci]